MLARVIDAVGPLRLEQKKTASLFAALAESIVYQQLNGRAAATIHARVCALFPRAQDGPTPAQILRAPDEKLRGAGLSRAKLLAIRDLAHQAKQGEIPTLEQARALDDAELIERLTAVRGIGRWTVQMLLIFRLGRPDVLPSRRLRRPQGLRDRVPQARAAGAEGRREARRALGAAPQRGELVPVARHELDAL